MRLRTFLFVALVLLARVQLTYCTGVGGSHNSFEAFEAGDDGDDATTPSPRDRQGDSLNRGTSRLTRGDSMLSHVPRPLPVLTGRPSTGGLRLREPQKQAPVTSEVKVEAPEPHPMLAPLRAQALRKGKSKLRRSRDEDEHVEVSSTQRDEGEGRRRVHFRSDSGGRPRKIRQTEAGPSRLDLEEESSSPPPQPHAPPRQPVILPGIPIAADSAHSQHPPPNNPPLDAFLTNLFNSYHSFPQSGLSHQLQTFDFNGLRYGHFPATEPLAEPPAFALRDPYAGTASVLRPADVRWTFGQVDHRRAAYEMARSRHNTVAIRTTMANEAKRLYELEANNIRKSIEKHELPLDTSDEWRNWVGQYGVELLKAQIDP